MANRGDVISVDKLWDIFDLEREKSVGGRGCAYWLTEMERCRRKNQHHQQP